MKLIRLITAATLCFGFYSTAFAKSSSIYAVPFYHLKIKADRSISAIYSFDPAHQVLVCKADKFTSPNIAYPLGRNTLHYYMPIRLTANPAFQGHLANPNGTIKISNTDATSVPIECYNLTVG